MTEASQPTLRLTLAALAGAGVGYAVTWWATHGHRCGRCGTDDIHVSVTCRDGYETTGCDGCSDIADICAEAGIIYPPVPAES